MTYVPPFVCRSAITIAILTSGYVLTTTIYSSVIYLSCLVLISVILMLAITSKSKVDIKKFKLSLASLVIVTIFSTTTLLGNATLENAVSLGKFLISLSFGATLFTMFSFRKFTILFSNAILLICIISLTGYALANYTNFLSGLPVVNNVNDVDYKFGFIFAFFDGFLSYRNIGVFWEPGIFASIIFCALLVDLFLSEQPKILRTAILLITLATTFAGSALILFAIYYGLVVTRNTKDRQKIKFVSITLVVGVICLAGFLTTANDSDTDENFARAIEKVYSPEEAQATRLVSPINNISVFIEKPILGWGFNSALQQYLLIDNSIALTSTSTHLIAALGAIGILYTIVPLVGIFRLRHENLVTRSLLAIAFLFIVNKEPHTYFTLTHAVFYFLVPVALGGALRAPRKISDPRLTEKITSY